VGQRGGDQRSASGGGLPLPELSARGGRLRVYEIPSLHPSTLSGARAVLGSVLRCRRYWSRRSSWACSPSLC